MPSFTSSVRDYGSPRARGRRQAGFVAPMATDIHLSHRYINLARHHVRVFGVGLDFEMTGSTRSSDGLDDRRKRLLFRCWHRGTREMDLILDRFADAEIPSLRDEELT